ncbi:MAG: TIGR02206 family membrane protein [Anaerolineae bacterium]|nr:TIGR02206 family membrane protein [Anaerolineae bacterium]
MNEFFTGAYSGPPFQLFGTPHLIALGIVALINVALIVFGTRVSERWRRVIRYGLAGLLLVDEALWHWWNWATGQWSIQETLPLHLCSVLVFLSAIMLITKSYAIYEFAYLLGIAGALQALLTPDAGRFGFPHFRFFQVMVSHGSIVAAAVYMTAVEGYRPTPASIKRVVVRTNLYALFVGLVNALIGSNYLFIARKPATASLLDVLPAWPWYLPILELLALVMIGLLYLPFAVKDLKEKRAVQGAISLTRTP